MKSVVEHGGCVEWMRSVSQHEVFEESGKLDALQDAILTYRQLLSSTTDGSTDNGACRILSKLSHALQRRYEQLGVLEDLEEAISLSTRAVSKCPDTSAVDDAHLGALITAGSSCRVRYERTGDSDNLNAAIQYCQDAVRRLGISHALRPMALNQLGASLRTQVEDAPGSDKDFTEVFRIHRESVALTSLGHPERPRSLAQLATDLWLSYAYTGCAAHLSESLTILDAALACCPSSHPDRARILNGKAGALRLRSQSHAQAHAGASIADVDSAIAVYCEARALCLPSNPLYLMILGNIAVARSMRFERLGDHADLDAAITVHEQGLAVLEPDSQAYLDWAGNLVVGLNKRIAARGLSSDIDRAIKLSKTLHSLVSRANPRYFVMALNYALPLLHRFKRHGLVDDLEESIHLIREARAAHPDGGRAMADILATLAQAIRLRYELAREEADISEAIELHEQTLLILSESNPNRPNTLCDLGSMLRLRFESSTAGNRADLDNAVTVQREALSLLNKENPFRYNHFLGLGHTLVLRAEVRASPEDIEEAIDVLKTTIDVCGTSLSCPIALKALANAYRQRARLVTTGHSQDTHLAKSYLEESLALSPPGRPFRAPVLFDLADLYFDPDVPFHDPNVGVEYLTDALGDSFCDARYRLERGTLILERTFSPLFAHPTLPIAQASTWHSKLSAAYGTAVSLLATMQLVGLRVSARLRAISQSQHLVVNGALHELSLQRHAQALELLEEGRGVFWSEALKLRTPLDDVPGGLKEELREISRELEQGSYTDHTTATITGSGTLPNGQRAAEEREVARRRKLGSRFDSLVASVRAIPRFARFLLPPEFSALQQVADKGPVVVLLAGSLACGAVILRQGCAPLGIPLKMMTEPWLVESGRAWRNGAREVLSRDEGEQDMDERDVKRSMQRKTIKRPAGSTQEYSVLGKLWTSVVKPVLDAIGLQNAGDRARPRLWWCCTSYFSTLPIHAAGYYPKGQCCSDYVISSYTPTLRALIDARTDYRPIQREEVCILLAGAPGDEEGQWKHIPSTIVEVRHVAKMVSNHHILCLPKDEDIVSNPECAGIGISTALENIPRAQILHLACHGKQDPQNPLESGFLLRDGLLTIAQLMSLPRTHAFLAFLNACDTAKVSKDQPDETVSLASTMLFTGFKSVVATLWGMGDIDGPLVAKTIYEELFKEDAESRFLDPDAVPYALDMAGRKLREQNLSAMRWATYVHIGM